MYLLYNVFLHFKYNFNRCIWVKRYGFLLVSLNPLRYLIYLKKGLLALTKATIIVFSHSAFIPSLFQTGGNNQVK